MVHNTAVEDRGIYIKLHRNQFNYQNNLQCQSWTGLSDLTFKPQVFVGIWL